MRLPGLLSEQPKFHPFPSINHLLILPISLRRLSVAFRLTKFPLGHTLTKLQHLLLLPVTNLLLITHLFILTPRHPPSTSNPLDLLGRKHRDFLLMFQLMKLLLTIVKSLTKQRLLKHTLLPLSLLLPLFTKLLLLRLLTDLFLLKLDLLGLDSGPLRMHRCTSLLPLTGHLLRPPFKFQILAVTSPTTDLKLLHPAQRGTLGLPSALLLPIQLVVLVTKLKLLLLLPITNYRHRWCTEIGKFNVFLHYPWKE